MLSHATRSTLAVLLLSAAGAHAQDFVNVRVECPAPLLLPEPTGPHQVGTVSYHWSDVAREDHLTEDPHDSRQVIVRLFYPGLRTHDGPTARYIPELDMLRQGFGSDTRDVPRQIADDLDAHGCVLTSSFTEIPLDGASQRYPVLLFSPGGNMSRHWHTALAQELASQGYVVAVMSHAHSGLDVFPRGGFLMSSSYWNAPAGSSSEERAALANELAELLADDAIFTLDQLVAIDAADPAGRFTGRLDLERVGILGHSRGGTTVGRACATDDRFRACVVYDNIGPEQQVTAGLRKPQLVVRRPWPEDRTATLHGYLERNTSVAYDVVVDGTIHMSFSDLPFVEPHRHASGIPAERAHRITAEITRAFLDGHLPPPGRSGLSAIVSQYPEARLQVFGRPGTDSAAATSGPSKGARADSAIPTGRFAAAPAFADSVGTDAYLLLIGGEIVDAYGDLSREYRLHSVRKSLLSTLYGIALARGTADTAATLGHLHIQVDDRLTDEERKATVRHLLQSRSGVFLPATFENAGFDAVRPVRGSHPAGAHWFYSNWDFNAAGTAYQIMTGESLFRAFARDIAGPIGMEDFGLEDGRWRYSPRSRQPAYVFRMSTRDVARFGQLMLQGGRWERHQVVPNDWIAEITRSHSQATRPDGESMEGVGYGMMWWVAPANLHGVDLGAGAFYASGTGTQLLLVAPALDLVYVHRNDTDAPADQYRSVSEGAAFRILALLMERLDE